MNVRDHTLKELSAAIAVGAALGVSGCAAGPEPRPGMALVEGEGVSVHVDSWGQGEPVLLIHGASSDMDVFKPSIIPALQDSYRLTAYDRPGHGFSPDRPEGAETLAVQAAVAADVIRMRGLQRPIVLAHSWGGAVALRLALDHPELVGGLVLVAPVAYEWPGGVSWHLHWSGHPLAGPLFNHVLSRPFADAAVRSGMTSAFAPAPVPEGYFEAASVARAGDPRSLRSNGLELLSSKREVKAQQDRYASISVPVAILAGDGDTVVNTGIHSRRLAETLPTVRLEVLDGVGHLPHEYSPATVRELVDWVLQRRDKK